MPFRTGLADFIQQKEAITASIFHWRSRNDSAFLAREAGPGRSGLANGMLKGRFRRRGSLDVIEQHPVLAEAAG